LRCSDTDLYALAESLSRALLARGATVATAESCTGGWIAKALTDVPGSSAWFGTGFVSYSNAAKDALLGVPAALLAEHGAVSEAVVRAMVEGCLARSGAAIAVAVSGIAGPDGGSPAKPVGSVWLAVGDTGHVSAVLHRFAGDREAVRRQTVAAALVAVLERVNGTG
jgi:nicotinamide-nucleotide amidase